MSTTDCSTCIGDTPCCWENPSTWTGKAPSAVRWRWWFGWLNGLWRRHREPKGWMAPRGGGYRPGLNNRPSIVVTARVPIPPKGGAGIGKS